MIVQSDAFNHSRIATVLAVALTTDVRLADAPGNVLLYRDETGLRRDSVANVSQVVTADRRFLTDRISELSPRLLAAVENGLRLALGL